MPTVDENKQAWDGGYKWTSQGDEWSGRWGSPAMQWYGTILPRIHSFVFTDNILEIACGYGRWTNFLKNMCHKLVAIDLSEECVQACRQRFIESSNIEYHTNDGKSLAMVSDFSIDFVFSFDSLVHADLSVLRAYISQLDRIMKQDGVAFIHHSNLGEYSPMYSRIRKVPRLEKFLRQFGVLEQKLHWRDPGVSAKLVEGLAQEYDLQCIGQEIVPWATKRAQIDCFSVIVKKTSSLARNNQVVRNAGFTQEVKNLSRLDTLYTHKSELGH
jgi:ubiquinone/menaquinone biosynthesis C-methylase UbiE